MCGPWGWARRNLFLLAAVLACGLAVRAAPAFVTYEDPEAGFRILRYAPWKVERDQTLGLRVFYARSHLDPPRFLVLARLPVLGRHTVRSATRMVLEEVLALKQRPGYRLWLRAWTGRAEGEVRWGPPVRVRAVFWAWVRPGQSGTVVTLLAGEGPQEEFDRYRPVFERMRASYEELPR